MCEKKRARERPVCSSDSELMEILRLMRLPPREPVGSASYSEAVGEESVFFSALPDDAVSLLRGALVLWFFPA